MNILRFAIERKVFVSMVFLGLSLLGLISYRQLPLELMPNVELPTLIVQVTAQREMDPEYMEKQAIIPLEGVIGSLEGISSLEASAEQRRGTIVIYFDQDVNIGYAYLKLSDRIQGILPTLSEEFTVRVQKVDTERLANMFMRLQVRGSGGLDRVRAIIDNTIIGEFETIDGIANVQVAGGQEKSVEITLDEEAVDAYHITPSEIRNLIRQNNARRAFLGHAYERDRHFFVNVESDYSAIRDLEYIVVDPSGPVLLKDIATIVFGVKEQTTISRVNGKDAVTMQLVRDANVNLIDLSHETRDVIEQLNRELEYQDVEVIIQSDTAEEMEKNIDLLMELALIGGLLAVVILWFFLRNIRVVVTVLLSIPVSILIAFNCFYAYDISINSLTLVGMVLAIGMLLDNSVVVLENIHRHVSLGEDHTTAVLRGTHEVWRSIVAATLTTLTVFLPFIFSSNPLVMMIGRHIGVSIISTLLVSLFAALLLVPMMTHGILGSVVGKLKSFSAVLQETRLVQIYTVLLKATLRFPAPTVSAVIVVFFVSIAICLALSLNVPKAVEQNEFNVYVSMSRGSTLDQTDDITKDLETILAEIEEIDEIITTVYEEEAALTVVLKEEFELLNARSIPQVKNMVESRIDNFRGADISLSEPKSSARFGKGMGGNRSASLQRMFGMGSQQEQVLIKGSDFEMLRNVVDDVEYLLEELETVSRVNTNVPGNRPEVHLLFDHHLMSEYDVPVTSVSSELGAFENEVSSGTKFTVGTDEYDITIRNTNVDEEKTYDQLRHLDIPSQSASSMELEQISRIVYSYGVSGITRINQEKQIEVAFAFEYEINESNTLLDQAREEITDLVGTLTIPTGVAIEVVHDESQFDEFYFLIGAAFILIYMILASVFESISTPIVMMFTIPLATIGSFWALIFTGNTLFNANTLIGFLILLGVVVNNGIILIDYTNILRRKGYRRSRALLTAGQARVRPILITAITTIVAMLPLAMGESEYVSQIGASFAITVIGGLAVSTLFTLLFIPTVYAGLENVLAWLHGMNWKVKVAQLSVVTGGMALIYYEVNSMLWQAVYMVVLIAAVPGLTWFIQMSLRQARADFIPKDEDVRIHIRRMLKIYDDHTRFVREWTQGERSARHQEETPDYSHGENFKHYAWQIPLMGFFVYFIYFYLDSPGWLFLLSVPLYFYTLLVWSSVAEYLFHRGVYQQSRRHRLLGSFCEKLILWGFPLFSLIVFYVREFPPPVIVFIGLVWYAAIIVSTASSRLHRKNINIMRLTGKFAGVRRHFYRFIRSIPVLGRRKKPFHALSGVSLKIGNGMFGLLGPNGAGKTTLMRIICGVLTQSRGTLRINDMNVQDKREELQGVIGYLPQEFGFYENLTAAQFLDYMAILKSLYDRHKRNEIVQYTLKSVHLTEHQDRKIGTYSGGMKQRLGIAMALLHLPRILVVDEPTAGLDPRERIRFRNLMVELSRERIVIFSTHIIEDISSSCNNLAVLNRGALYYEGNPQGMTEAAADKVWQVLVTPDEFTELRDTLWIVHHMRLQEKIRVRCLAAEQPHPEAEPVSATLEDAYLWLMRGREQEAVTITA